MIRCLGAVFHLAQSLVDVGSGFTDGLGEQFRIHEVGAGAGGKVAAVFYSLHAAEIDFTVAFYCVFNGISGCGEGWRIKDDYIKHFTFLF